MQILTDNSYYFRKQTLVPLPITFGFPPNPNIIAATIVDLPEPFGPIIMFKLGPGYISA